MWDFVEFQLIYLFEKIYACYQLAMDGEEALYIIYNCIDKIKTYQQFNVAIFNVG